MAGERGLALVPQSAEVGEARQWAAFVGRDDLVHYPSAQVAEKRRPTEESERCVPAILLSSVASLLLLAYTQSQCARCLREHGGSSVRRRDTSRRHLAGWIAMPSLAWARW